MRHCEEVGAIVKKMDGASFNEIIMKKSAQIRTLAHVTTTSTGTKGL